MPCSPSKFLRSTSRKPVSGPPVLLGFSALFATTAGVVHSVQEHTRSRYVPPTGFRSLSTGYSDSSLPGLFHPGATYRVPSVQGFLPTRSLPGSSPVRAPMMLAPFGSPMVRGPSTATSGCLTFEALLRESKRSSRSVFSLPLRRSPLRFSSSSRSSSAHREPGSPGHPLTTLSVDHVPTPRCEHGPRRTVLSVLSVRFLAAAVAGATPCSRSVAC